MRTRLVVCLALLVPGLGRPAAARGADVKPVLVARAKALDDLTADAHYLATLVGRGELAKQFESALKARTGEKGLDGLDPKKPLGFYATLAKKLPESTFVLLLPVADEATFLKTLENLSLTPEKGDGGLYTIKAEGVPYPLLFRFANGYLYGTVKLTDAQAASLDKEKLPKPGDVLAEGTGSVLSLTADLDQIPDGMKKIATVFASQAVASARDQEPPGETEAQKKLRGEVLDELDRMAKAAIEESGRVTFRLDLDRKAHDLGATLNLTPKPGSGLASAVAALNPERGVGGGIGKGGPDSAVNGSLYLAFPEALRKSLAPVIDEGVTKGLEREKDEAKRAPGAVLAEALTPTAKAAVFDAGIDLRGPGKGGKYLLLSGVSVKEGKKIEAAFKKVVAKQGDAVRAAIRFDVAKVGEVNVHEISAKDADAKAKAAFGEGPGYVAFRDDAVLLAAGEGALEAIREAVKAEPAAGKMLQLELALARVAQAMAAQHEEAPSAAKLAFTEKGSDRVRLTVDAGKTLAVKLEMKTAVLAFAHQMEQAKKGEKDDK